MAVGMYGEAEHSGTLVAQRVWSVAQGNVCALGTRQGNDIKIG